TSVASHSSTFPLPSNTRPLGRPAFLAAPRPSLALSMVLVALAAVGSSGFRDNSGSLALTDKPLLPKLLRDVGDRRNVLPMILPRSVAGHQLLDAATLCVHDGTGRSVRTLIQGIRNAIRVLIGLAGKREACVKGALVRDVRPDAQP